MSSATAERLERLLGGSVLSAHRIEGGYTPALRWVVKLADGRSAFVKQAVEESIVERLRREHDAYSGLRGPWCPVLVAFEDGAAPLLVLEDLSACHWPPPWKAGHVQAVRDALEAVAAHPAPPRLRRLIDTDMASCGWPEVADDPAPFLNLGLCTRRWLERSLPTLLSAADPGLLDGVALCHLDVRSDNLCFRPDGQAVLVDWDCAVVGNPEFDLAFWLPSLHLEGGPPPHCVADVRPGVAALVAGFFASQAGLPIIPVAPRVREIQLRQLEVALPWAAGALELDAPDGPRGARAGQE